MGFLRKDETMNTLVNILIFAGMYLSLTVI